MHPATGRTGITLILVLAIAALAGLQCDKKESTSKLTLAITAQPVGGQGINTVSCTFEATAVDIDGRSGDLASAVLVVTEWHSTSHRYNREEHFWHTHGETRTITTSKTASAGYLDKPFWLEINWIDAFGEHTVLSDTAYCQ